MTLLFLKTPNEQNLNDKTILNIFSIFRCFCFIIDILYILKLLNPLKTITNVIENFVKRKSIYKNRYKLKR